MKTIFVKDIAKPSVIGKIKAHALGSLYRMNAQSADCYAFSIDADGNDFSGGWDWKNDLVDKNASYILDLKSKKFYQIT